MSMNQQDFHLHISDYLVIEETTPEKLTRSVKAYMEKGWKPYGGVSYGFASGGLFKLPNRYCQALVIFET